MKNQPQNGLCDNKTKVSKSQEILRVNIFMVCNEYMITKNALLPKIMVFAFYENILSFFKKLDS